MDDRDDRPPTNRAPAPDPTSLTAPAADPPTAPPADPDSAPAAPSAGDADPSPDVDPTADADPTPTAAAETTRLLSGARAYIQTLPAQERHIATLAADGSPVWAIAQELRISDAAVARTLDGVLAAVTGRQLTPVETGGLGADTDPGVTGGYGDTGFGALDLEPTPDNTEPEEG